MVKGTNGPWALAPVGFRYPEAQSSSSSSRLSHPSALLQSALAPFGTPPAGAAPTVGAPPRALRHGHHPPVRDYDAITALHPWALLPVGAPPAGCFSRWCLLPSALFSHPEAQLLPSALAPVDAPLVGSPSHP